jgi:RES domain-containing protein
MTAVRPADRIEPRLLTSWRGTAWCHVPAEQALDPERLVTLGGDDDRWNGPGEPAVYLAIEPATAIAELARHLRPPLDQEAAWRRLVGLSIDLDGLADLRQPATRSAFGVDDPAAFRDRGLTRSLARRIRDDEATIGLLVPSVAFLDEADDGSRGNLVIFEERISGGVRTLLRATVEGGYVDLRGAM